MNNHNENHSEYLQDIDQNYNYDEVSEGSSHAFVFEIVGVNKKVLEIGAGSGIIGFYLKKFKNCNVTALELEPSPKLTSRVDRVYACDLNTHDWADLFDKEDTFDTIIAADVLEHLYDPLAVIKTMRKLLRSDGEIIISLPNVGHACVIASLFNHDFEYRKDGLLDKTHIRFFSLDNVSALHKAAELSIVDARFVVKRPEDVELAHQWKALPYRLKKAISLEKKALIYQVVTKAVPAEKTASESIDLNRLPVDLDFHDYIGPDSAFFRIRVAEFLCSLSREVRRFGSEYGFFVKLADSLHKAGDQLYRDTRLRCDYTALDR